MAERSGRFFVNPQTSRGRMEALRTVINITDVKSEAIYLTDDPLRDATADLGGARSFVAIPMLAEDKSADLHDPSTDRSTIFQ